MLLPKPQPGQCAKPAACSGQRLNWECAEGCQNAKAASATNQKVASKMPGVVRI